MNTNRIVDKIRGCIWGSLIGDALGTRYEFLSEREAIVAVDGDKENNTVLPMLGGGPFGLKPGQITDDGELTVSLLKAISSNNGIYDANKVAESYLRWFKSNPFDIGRTTTQAFQIQDSMIRSNLPLYNIVLNNSRTHNMNSLSNGCLMRASPLGILAYFHPNPKLIHNLATLDCSMTNPNTDCINAVEIYITVIAMVLMDYNKKQIYDGIMKIANEENKKIIKASWTTRTVTKDHKIYTADGINMGYYGIALQNALYHLFHGTKFREAMEGTIMLGGDTDTNCCILGGILGAKYGLSNGIPIEWFEKVRNLTKPAHNRFVKLPIIRPEKIEQSIQDLISIVMVMS